MENQEKREIGYPVISKATLYVLSLNEKGRLVFKHEGAGDFDSRSFEIIQENMLENQLFLVVGFGGDIVRKENGIEVPPNLRYIISKGHIFSHLNNHPELMKILKNVEEKEVEVYSTKVTVKIANHKGLDTMDISFEDAMKIILGFKNSQ